MTPQISLVLAAGLATLWTAPVHASTLTAPSFEPRIVINENDGADGARALGAPFDGVVQLRFGSADQKYCSGTLIAPGAVLTARHCIDIYRSDGTFSFTVQSRDLKVGFTDPDGGNITRVGVSAIQRFTADLPEFDRGAFFNGSDLALLFLSTPVPDRTPFAFVTDPRPGEVGLMVGYGAHGVAREGAPTDRSATYQGERWGALNTMDLVGPSSIFGGPAPDFTVSGDNSLIYSDFDAPSGTVNSLGLVSDPAMIEGEGTTAPGDSGGPLLVQRDGVWLLAGILTGGSVFSDSTWITYGDVSVWTGITSDPARAFVLSGGGVLYGGPAAIIPLPPSGGLLLG
ncbi:trypsin-like serine protease, partial [Rhodobaculum claviforme]